MVFFYYPGLGLGLGWVEYQNAIPNSGLNVGDAIPDPTCPNAIPIWSFPCLTLWQVLAAYLVAFCADKCPSTVIVEYRILKEPVSEKTAMTFLETIGS